MTAILILGGFRVIDGSFTLGSLVAFQALMASFSEPVATLVNQAGSFQLIKGALYRLEDVYNYPPGDPPRASDQPFPAKLAGRIEFTGRSVRLFAARAAADLGSLASPSTRDRAWRWSAPPAAANPPSAAWLAGSTGRGPARS